jgi:hypothetical protein
MEVTKMPKPTRICLCGMMLLCLTGCPTDAPKTGAVQGRVYFHNQPLHGGTIVFTPDAERGNDGPMATGEIQADGSYKLQTGKEPGAVVGWHRVTIASGPEGTQLLPRKYSDPKLSDQSREVKAGQANAFDFHLE